MMTREEFYNFERGERSYYESLDDMEGEAYLPLTFDGFEALLKVVADVNDLPVDNRLRSLLAGYIHHIPSDEITLDLEKLAKAFYKSFSNSMTYDIDQKAKAEEIAAFNKKQEELKKDSNVLPINGAGENK